jgi:hypothetical protein
MSKRHDPRGRRKAEVTVQTYSAGGKNTGVEAGSSKTPEGTGERKQQAEAAGGRVVSGEAGPQGCSRGKLLSPVFTSKAFPFV